jgi:hypothetical protein
LHTAGGTPVAAVVAQPVVNAAMKQDAMTAMGPNRRWFGMVQNSWRCHLEWNALPSATMIGASASSSSVVNALKIDIREKRRRIDGNGTIGLRVRTLKFACFTVTHGMCGPKFRV